jgi:hypothetical protein
VYKLDLESGEPAEGSPVTAGDRVLADLTAVDTEDGEAIYIIPTDRTLYILQAESPLTSPNSINLP